MDEMMAMLSGDRDPDLVHLTTPPDEGELANQCRDRNLQLFVLNGDRITNKAEFLAACAQVMQFPAYFGQNWDAFEDCLTDLDWLPAQGYVLLYTHSQRYAQADPANWDILLDIFHSAIAYWKQTSSPMYILLS